MISKEQNRLIDALQFAFPESDIIITDEAGAVVFSKLSLNVLENPAFRPNAHMSSFIRTGREYHLISLFLPGRLRLALGCRAEDYDSPAVPLAMVFSLWQAVFLPEDSTPPKLLRDTFSLFIKQILQGPVSEDASLISLLAAELNIDLTIPRVVSVLSLASGVENSIQKQGDLSSAVDIIRAFKPTDAHDIVGIVENSQILICRGLKQNGLAAKTQYGKYFSNLHEYLSSHFEGDTRKVFIGIGFTATKIPEYAHSYAFARRALQYGYASPVGISYALDHLMEIIFENTPSEILEHFLTDDVNMIAKNPALFRIVEALIAHNMNITEAAKSLYIHRNTLILQMRQIRSILALDPVNNDNDRYILHLIYGYYKWQMHLSR